jgi:hypothetical protein
MIKTIIVHPPIRIIPIELIQRLLVIFVVFKIVFLLDSSLSIKIDLPSRRVTRPLVLIV